jgi:hypothetical protein
MIEKVEGQVIEWKKKLDEIPDRLNNSSNTAFNEIQDSVLSKLISFGCAKHQGYVMNGFHLDSEMASYIFLEPSDDAFEFNELTKPDYVILLNRFIDRSEFCNKYDSESKIDEKEEVIKMEKDLKKY